MSERIDRRRVDNSRYGSDRRAGRDRRRGPDPLRRLLPYMAFFNWVLVVAAFFLISYAKPQTETFFERFHHLPVRTEWNTALLDYVFWLLLGGIIMGLGGVVANFMRSRRKGDTFYVSLVAGGVLAMLFLLWIVRV
ncbi:MAG: hypothetical protein JXR59_10450 [Desulfuromonadaceae bacterium]|nr:hypothetical protein [Desulfuromonadaceae bacterium]